MQFLLKLVYIYLNDSDKEDSTGADTPLSSGGKSDQKTGKQINDHYFIKQEKVGC